MSYFSSDDLARKDFLIALGIWLSLEFVAFVVFPALNLIDPGDRWNTWFLISLPLGVGGAFILGMSSRFVAISNELADKTNRGLRLFVGQFAGWLGLLGIAFPLLMISLEFFTMLFIRFSEASQ